jgi:hypothetical protein
MTARLVIIVVAMLALITGLAIDPRSTLSAYLVAWVAIGVIPLGVLGLLMTSYLVRRAWTDALHAIMASATSVLPILAVMLLPVLIGLKELYPAVSAGHALPAFKAFYLAPWFFVLRTVITFAALCAVALWQQATWGSPDRMMRSASVGLIVWALLVSLAGVDWIESLEPSFHSSEYGLYFLCFTLLDGTAFAILTGLASGRGIGATRGYSALLLSVLLLWTYVHAMQYIVIWAADIPDEVVWYIKRSSDGWQFVLAVVAFGQFVFPFFALLNSGVRSSRTWLMALCALTLAMRCWEASILILPAIEHIAPVVVILMLPASLAFVAVSLWWAYERALANDGRLFRFSGRHARAEAEVR